jgi:hydrogenase 3 maturation protease
MGMADSEKQNIDINSSLTEWFAGAERVVVAGIGNPFRRDDFVGVQIVKNLHDKVSESVFLIEAETAPESFMDPITKFKPTHILLIDAGVMNLEPGTPKLADPTELMRRSSISTHTLPLRIFCEYLTKTTNAKLALLIIQPLDASFGEGLTPKVKQTAKNLTALLQKLLP